MNMRDARLSFSFADALVRGAVVHLDASWAEVRRRAQSHVALEGLLGEALAAVCLLKSTVKLDGSVALQVQSMGAVKLLFAQVAEGGNLRGLTRSAESLESFDFSDLQRAQARMVITLEPRAGEQRYQGIVELEGDSLSSAITAYFERSEQLPTQVLLAANGERAAGFLLQRLPGHQGELADQSARWEHLSLLAATLKPEELLTLKPEELLTRLFHDEEVLLQSPVAHRFGCTCSRERVGNMLLGLGREESLASLTEHGLVEVDCEFCNAHYAYDIVDIEALFQAAFKPNASVQ